MDPNITKLLNDKLYDKRKSGALELEGLIRNALNAQDHDRIARIARSTPMLSTSRMHATAG
jgi:vacuole morphology and inheritance protein 14